MTLRSGRNARHAPIKARSRWTPEAKRAKVLHDVESRSIAVRKDAMLIAIVGRSRRSKLLLGPSLMRGLLGAALAALKVPCGTAAAR